MKKVKLVVRGTLALVGYGKLRPFEGLPDVLIWGSRLFFLSESIPPEEGEKDGVPYSIPVYIEAVSSALVSGVTQE